MDAWTLGLFAVGLVLLVGGAELLVRGASRLAMSVGVTPLVVGLTVVAFGTSAPELAVSVRGAYSGQADVAIGNVIGSNVFNVLFVLGLTALVAPLVVQARLVRFDVPLLIAVSGLTWWLAADGRLDRGEGLGLFGGIVVYTVVAILSGRRSAVVPASSPGTAPPTRDAPAQRRSRLRDGAYVLVGIAALIVGSGWLVDGAVAMARALGLSELVIGLTVVAAGTSLPEVATSVVAAIRGERDIAVGNVIGSCLFNLLAVLGGAAAIAPDGVAVSPAALAFDVPVMVATAVACLPIFFTGHRVSRLEGLLFLTYYIAYAAFLVLDATNHDALPVFSGVMLLAVLPLTVFGIAMSVTSSLRARRRA